MKKSNKAILVIFLTVFIDLVGFGIIIPLNPYLSRQFGATPFEVGLLMSVYSVMQFLFSPFWGSVSDRIGRRPIILLSLFGAGASHLLFAYADSVFMLFVARGLAGLFGANISTAMAYMADITEQKDRSKSMGLIGAAFGLGFILGPFIGGLTAELGRSLGSQPPLGDSLAAVVASVICLANLVLAVFVLEESLPAEQRAKARKRESRIKLLKRYLNLDTLGLLMITFFVSGFAMAHMEVSMFMYVEDKFQWDLVTASFGFAYVGLVIAFTQGFLIRKLMPKFGERKLLVAGSILSTAGFIGIGLSMNVPFLAVAVTLLGLGNGLINPSINGSISLLCDPSEQGTVMGVNQSLAAMARIVGPALGGFVYGRLGIESPFFIAGLISLIGVFIIIRIYKKLPEAGLEKQI